MNLDRLLKIINQQLIGSKNRPLNFTEIIILKGVWQYRTYTQMAIEADYSPGYFTNVVAPELYHRLSQLIGKRVTKKNCQELLESYVAAQITPDISVKLDVECNQDSLPCYPNGSLPLNSPFYLERPYLKEQVEREIEKPGALIRIKAPKEMGKTSLLLRILDRAEGLGYCTVSLNLEQVERAILSDLNLFLRWLCANTARQLQLEPRLEDYWDEVMGSKISCTLYFQEYILEQIDTSLVLALDDVNHIFEHTQVAKDFLPLLRSWYEEAKRLPIWRKLRLVVVHSTEIYVPLQLNQSPFNVGLPIQLNNFNQEEVQQLAKCYGLDWENGEEAQQLMSMVEGHPALVHLALYHLSRGDITLSELLKTAHTTNSIYAHHLQRHCVTLTEQPELAQALDRILNSDEPISLNPILTHKLSSMGLIKQLGGRTIAGCELYRRYLQNFIQEIYQNRQNIA